jgi:hypothetical protein
MGEQSPLSLKPILFCCPLHAAVLAQVVHTGGGELFFSVVIRLVHEILLLKLLEGLVARSAWTGISRPCMNEAIVRTLAAPIPSQKSVCRLRHGVKRKPKGFIVAEQVKKLVLSVSSRGKLGFKPRGIEIFSSTTIEVPSSIFNAPQIDT